MDRRIICFNGWNYPINDFVPGAECPAEVHWTRRKALAFASTIKTPTILVGFSRGATAALRVAMENTHVVHVIAHSPVFSRRIEIAPSCKVTLFRTRGDRTPTHRGTWDFYRRFQTAHVDVTLSDLPFLSFVPTTPTEVAMKSMRHVFHNAIDLLRAMLPGEAFEPKSLAK